ncbi:MAG TPA: hypothetical protein VM867_02630 [Xanthobacteraceae bacterium]|nr:hypothetical protein [Xanthobacteraceae bacterium]
MGPNNKEEAGQRRVGGGDVPKTAEYIAELCADLSRLAREESLDTLAYLLDMARLEAQSLAQQSRPSQPSS